MKKCLSVPAAADGCSFRCCVTDAVGNSVTSRMASVKVVGIPVTGDPQNPRADLLALLVAGAAALLIVLGRRRRRRSDG